MVAVFLMLQCGNTSRKIIDDFAMYSAPDPENQMLEGQQIENHKKHIRLI